jgi:hypothetical protein
MMHFMPECLLHTVIFVLNSTHLYLVGLGGRFGLTVLVGKRSMLWLLSLPAVTAGSNTIWQHAFTPMNQHRTVCLQPPLGNLSWSLP